MEVMALKNIRPESTAEEEYMENISTIVLNTLIVTTH